MESPEPALNRRHVLKAAGLMGLAARPAYAVPLIPRTLNLRGCFKQGGYAIGQADPHADVWVDGEWRTKASDIGSFFIGFDRDSPPQCLIELKGPVSGQYQKTTCDVYPATYDVQRVDGLPQNTVTPSDPALLERIAAEVALKNEAFAHREDADWFRDGFSWPLDIYRVSGTFGNQRILNGVPSRPHYGYDMAAPVGTPVHAPQTGRVVLAEPDLHFEGGLILIDHGQGVISMYLHLSQLFVAKGQLVPKGQLIGHVGAKGRSTGPHLCWRLKWRDRSLDPSLMVTD
ncbi:M23 family metallopeptidase [Asticcacaulis sp. SL142]|uniref:M23 family metallopeptidase n=1 Tax=Asticcacaulis sp. SL142 TaxID=2995155 RepID=UPI00226CEFD8|nr:M23 family metallopeptidase [Asticcacaulis sp. SL142]WAC48536.1 M23 family metallopeptidase [Asticcacaulis sp. SL142]